MRARRSCKKRFRVIISMIVHDADLEYFPSDIPDYFSIPHDDNCLTFPNNSSKKENIIFFTYFK